MPQVRVQRIQQPPIGEQRVEIVERKGLGHPDSICDAVMEAAAGKNPVSHIGKIYTVLSHRMADQIYRQVDGVREVYVWLVGQIGQPVDQPWVAVQLIQESEAECERITQECTLVIDQELNRLNDFCMELTEGKYPVC
jgi:S-adenosylmethionine synthetase